LKLGHLMLKISHLSDEFFFTEIVDVSVFAHLQSKDNCQTNTKMHC
jgi:hypothetical protein